MRVKMKRLSAFLLTTLLLLTVVPSFAAKDDPIIWQLLESKHWVEEGNADAPVLVYDFIDPNCPFCRTFHANAQPWVKAGKVKLRHLPVGILGQDSPEKAAAILGSSDPLATYHQVHAKPTGSELALSQADINNGMEKMRENTLFMIGLELSGTPSILMLTPSNQVKVKVGSPSEEELLELMGSPKP